MTPKELSQRAVRFYHRYGEELESIRQILHIQLDKLALACTFENRLPRKAIKVVSRTKELKNFLPKLQAVAEQIDLDTGNGPELFPTERMKDNYLVEPVDKLRAEMLTDNFQNRTFHFLIMLAARFFLNELRTEI